MPIQAPSWTEFLSCPICCNEFAINHRLPISLGCGHTICRLCLATLHNRQCPFDQTAITTDVSNLPINNALLQLVSTNNNNGSRCDVESTAISQTPPSVRNLNAEDLKCYKLAKKCIEDLALHLKAVLTNGNFGNMLSRPMQRKLVSLVNCQLMEEEGRVRALRAARSLGERTVTELILQHQNSQQLSSNLWAAVRSRGCQFLGPAMQEEVLKLVLLALQDGSALSRKVLVMFVVQRLEPHFPQASKTSIGHVVQLLYRASCFKVSKREADSSLMQLKDEFRTYDALRREHDAQIVQIATEAGLRIAPDQWSSLLYGDAAHKSHMQSISDKLQTPSSFAQSVQELLIALQRTGDPANLARLHTHLKHLSSIDPTSENSSPTWQDLAYTLDAVRQVVLGLVEFVQHHGNRKLQECITTQNNINPKYKISLCRDLVLRRICPRGASCTFAHSEEELERYRAKNRKSTKNGVPLNSGSQNLLNPKKEFQPHHIHHSSHINSLHSGDETATCPSTSTSPLRYAAHSSIALNNYAEGSSSRHSLGPQQSGTHQIRPLHSPIPPNKSAIAAAGPPPITVPSIHQRFEAPYGAINFPSSSSLMPPVLPPTNVTNTNPPKYAGNNSSPAIGSSINNNGIYNVLASDVYNASMMSFFNNGKNNNTTNNNNSNNNNSKNDFPISLSGMKLLPPVNSPWEQQPHLTGMDLLAAINQHSIYVLPDTSFFGKKSNNSNVEMNKSLNGGVAPFCDTYMFKNLLNNNNNNGNSNTTNSFLTDTNSYNTKSSGLLSSSSQVSQSPFWNSYNVTLGSGSQENVQSEGPVKENMTNAPQSTAVSFRDRESFVRSDSILDDDAATFEVPASSTSIVNKFGPICPMYKELNAPSTITNKHSYLDSWNYAISNNKSNDHPLLELNSPRSDHYSVFSSGNENDLSLPEPMQRNSNTTLEFNKHLEATILKLQDLQANSKKPEKSISNDSKEFDLGLRNFQVINTDGDHHKASNINEDSSVDNSFIWNIGAKSSKSIWSDTTTSPTDSNGMGTTAMAKDQPERQQMLQTQQQQHQQHQKPQQQQHQLLRNCKTGEEGYESSIEHGMLRDIEMELAEIVDKVWSNADDSGIKSEESVSSSSLNWPKQ